MTVTVRRQFLEGFGDHALDLGIAELAGCQVPSFVEAERVFSSQAAEAAGGCA